MREPDVEGLYEIPQEVIDRPSQERVLKGSCPAMEEKKKCGFKGCTRHTRNRGKFGENKGGFRQGGGSDALRYGKGMVYYVPTQKRLGEIEYERNEDTFRRRGLPDQRKKEEVASYKLCQGGGAVVNGDFSKIMTDPGERASSSNREGKKDKWIPSEKEWETCYRKRVNWGYRTGLEVRDSKERAISSRR